MFKKPEDAHMTPEETARYGREINGRSAQYENVEFGVEETPAQSKVPLPLSEQEIKKRVGKQNYKNSNDDNMQGSINS